MKSYRPYVWPLSQNSVEDRHRWDDVLTARGGKQPPEPVRNLRVAGGAMKLLVEWDAPVILDNVGGYRVYLDTEENLVKDIRDPQTTSAEIVVNDPDQHNVFVSCLSSLGRESSLVSTVGASNGDYVFNGLQQTGQLKGTFKNNPVNTQGTYTGANPCTQDGTTKVINIAANSQKFGDGTVSYNSGSVDPGSYGTFYIFADDPDFSGGTVTYQFSTNPADMTAANGRVFFGKITTSVSGGGSGSGGGGGCVELGTVVIEPEGSTQKIIENSDWVGIEMAGHEPVNMHPDTMVCVWKRASELQEGDRISVGFEGRWRTDWKATRFNRDSFKVKRTCPGGRYRAGTAQIELHNAKAPLI